MPRLRRCPHSILLMFWTFSVACLIGLPAHAATKGGGGTTTSTVQKCISAFQVCEAPCGGYPPQFVTTVMRAARPTIQFAFQRLRVGRAEPK